MDENAVFRNLRNDLATTNESDAVVRAMERFAQVLVTTIGAPLAQLHAVVDQLKHDINAARYNGDTFRTVFGGKGPVAQRLVEHAMLDELLFGKKSQPKLQRVQELLGKLNYHPTDDSAQIHEIHRFMEAVFQSLQPEHLKVTPFQPYQLMSPRTAKTGFYYQEGAEGELLSSLVLAGQIEGTQVRVSLFAGTSHAPQIFLYHPQECLWLPYEGTATIPGMIETLEKELQRAHLDLEEGHQGKDWQAEFNLVQAKAQEVFSRSETLPVSFRGFVRATEVHKEITVVEAGYKVMFCHTGGEYPSQSVTVLNNSGDSFAFATPFAAMSVELQRRLVCRLHHELDALLQAIQTSEQIDVKEAAAP